MSTGETIGQRYDAGPNGLNLLRLLLAVEVIAWHSYALRGDAWLPERAETLMEQLGVDSFFAISGFLICGAWSRRRHTRAYLAARARRIFPGLWVCLAVTAFLIAPATSYLAGGPQPSLAGQIDYVIANADTWGPQWSIDGTPSGVSDIGWNGSLWTLTYEISGYLAVAAVGVARLPRAAALASLAGSLWAVSLLYVLFSDAPGNSPICAAARFGLMFTLGGLAWLHRDRIPLSRLLGTAAATCVVAGAFLPNYRLLAAPAIAYLCLAAGAWLGRVPRLVWRNDLSYGAYIYAFPVQQALLVCGVRVGWFWFVCLSVLAVLPVAAASWFLVERPALPRSRRRAPAPTAAPARSAIAALQA